MVLRESPALTLFLKNSPSSPVENIYLTLYMMPLSLGSLLSLVMALFSPDHESSAKHVGERTG